MYFIGVDLGTSSIKAGIIDINGDVIKSSCMETDLISTAPGRMEQNPEDFYEKTLEIIKVVLEKSKISPKDVYSIAIDGQMGGIIGIDSDFNPITGLDMGLDIRSEKYNDYIHKNYKKLLRKKTCGSPRNIPKIMWWKKENSEVYKNILKFVTLNGFVGSKLAGIKGSEAYMDYTMLTFFGMEDFLKLNWSEELCELFDIDIKKLPRILSPWEVIGELDKKAAQKCGLLQGTKIVAGSGDQPAGLLGAGIVKPGMVVDVSGSSVLLFMAVNKFIPDTENGVIMYMPSVLSKVYYAFTYINGGGICLKWFKDEFLLEDDQGLSKNSKNEFDVIEEKIKDTPPGAGGLIFTPYFGGRQCSYDKNLKGAWIGLNWGHKKEHLYRAILESVAYDFNINISYMRELFPEFNIKRILVMGGGANSGVWNQIKSNVMGVTYGRIEGYQYALRGSGIIAGYGVSAIKDIKKVSSNINIERNITEYIPDKKIREIYQGYNKIYRNIFKNNLKKTFDLLSDQLCIE
jgi:xylulokinase